MIAKHKKDFDAHAARLEHARKFKGAPLRPFKRHNELPALEENENHVRHKSLAIPELRAEKHQVEERPDESRACKRLQSHVRVAHNRGQLERNRNKVA